MIRVVLPTAGIGSRLGSITENFNKALVPIGKKPAISHVIDYYPKDTKFIIALLLLWLIQIWMLHLFPLIIMTELALD